MVTMRARVKEADNGSPDLLYQWLPETAMSLMATIPTGTATVSIPHQNGRYPISRSRPETGDGFVIVYTRKGNGRYEAVEVLYNTATRDIGEFCDIASRRLADDFGDIRALRHQYAFFSPSMEEWGLILRDGGFTVFDPAIMEFDLSQETIRKRNGHSSSGITARIPVHRGVRPGSPTNLPVFTQVELTADTPPGLTSSWINFVEFQRARILRSRPPDRMLPHLRQWLQTFTKESGLKSWNFCKGMFFGDHIEWWGDGNRRRTAHEGIDFTQGFLPDGSIHYIPEGTPVRSIESGDLVSIIDDFLNKTLLVRHSKIRDEAGSVFHTLLSHIQPEACAPSPVTQGQILGRVFKSTNVRAPAHLHLTAAWIPDSIQASDITMDMISAAFMPIVLINLNCLLGTET
jgi:hypothetical protein